MCVYVGVGFYLLLFVVVGIVGVVVVVVIFRIVSRGERWMAWSGDCIHG